MKSCPAAAPESLAKIAAAYASPGWWYDLRGFFILVFCYRDSLLSLIRFFSRNLSAAHLEVAVGTGSFFRLVLLWRRLARLPASAGAAFDYAPSMLECAERGIRKDSGWDIRVADAGRMPYADDRFSTLNVANAVHCFPDLEAALSEMHRVLQGGGMLAVNGLLHPRGRGLRRRIADAIVRWGIRKGILVTSFGAEELKARFVAHGFTMVEERIRGNNYCLLLRKD